MDRSKHMNENDQDSLIVQLQSEMNGDREHDRALLRAWAEKLRDNTEAGPLLREIGAALFRLDEDGNRALTEQFLKEIQTKTEDLCAEARELIEAGDYGGALLKLKPAVGEIDRYPLSDAQVWMDFDRFLDGLLFQDIFAGKIAGREICRHPAHPAKLLYTYGSLLITMGRAKEAVEPLTRLIELDPVSPRYLFELGEAYKRSGNIQSAYETALLALSCAASNAELARCYRDLGYCLSEVEAYPDAICLYKLSLRFDVSNQAENELNWLWQVSGHSPDGYGEEEILACCKLRGIPMGMSKTVLDNLELLEHLSDETADSDGKEDAEHGV